MPKLVEGYNMLIWEHEDGTATWTGSFNAAEWADYASKSKKEVAEGMSVPSGADTSSAGPADLEEQPAGNASVDAWRGYALTQGATEDEVADLSRNELRDKYGKDES
jgi:hypothetical protein